MAEDRFEFGANWQAFLASVDEQRIDRAVESLRELLGLAAGESLEGVRFLDIGSGSGLFSLAAFRLGAVVTSLDYDVQSVACTNELRSRFAAGSPRWTVLQGSVLDDSFMEPLGEFDIVYSWGVLHHTGDMMQAINEATARVAAGGLFALAIYNDQGGASRRWLKIKTMYHRLPRILRPLWVVLVAGCNECKFALARLARLQNPLPFRDWREKRMDRGMSAWHDWVDWIGGMPFEVAKPEDIIVPLIKNGFVLQNLKTVGAGWGCNEYVFRRPDA